MAQISKGDTFTNGEQVTGARLNQLVDSSTLLVGAITDQPSITANTLEATDTTIVNDAGTLKEATIGDILNSNLPISTSSITGGAGVDITITPAATKKLDVAGAFEAESINSVGNTTVGGNLTVTGTINGAINTSNNITSSGTANFTGTLQINGTVGYMLTEIFEETMSPWSASANGTFNGIFTSSQFTKPAGEIWIFEAFFNIRGYFGLGGGEWAGRYGSVTPQTGAYIFHDYYFDSQGGGTFYRQSHFHRWTADAASTFTNETFKVDAFNDGVGLQLFQTVSTGHTLTTSVVPSKFRIYKYKTA